MSLLNCLAIDLDRAIAVFFSSSFESALAEVVPSLPVSVVGSSGLDVDTFPSDGDNLEGDDDADEEDDEDSSGCDFDGDRQSTELEIG